MNPSFSYLRLSVTDRCNFNCFYCRPVRQNRLLSENETLDLKETLALVRRLVSCGIRHVRLTGGEPLLRPRLLSLISGISRLPEVTILSLTTNGFKLGRMLPELKQNGINRINVSLDSLDARRFKKVTGSGGFSKVRSAVEKASQLGFQQVKLNVVVARHFNDSEIIDFALFGFKNRLDVRFIEFFPTQSRCDSSKDLFVPSSEVKNKLEEAFGPLTFLGSDPDSGPAQYFSVKGHASRIGFISSVSDFFCGKCNRLRLTADGKLYPCLHSEHHLDLKKPLRDGDDALLSAYMERITADKRMFNKSSCSRALEMSGIGG